MGYPVRKKSKLAVKENQEKTGDRISVGVVRCLLIIRARISVLVGFYIHRPQHFIHLKPFGFKSVFPLSSTVFHRSQGGCV